MSIIETVEIDVCVDCLFVALGDTSGIGTDAEIAAAVDAFDAGMGEWGDAHRAGDDPAPMARIVGTSGDTDEFSRAACGVCGTTLGGSRTPVTVFITD